MFDLPVIYDDYPHQEQVINQCIMEVAEAYKIDPLLLRAIREHERGDVGKRNPNTDGSYDYGPFQINNIHGPDLENFGITMHQVMYDPCLNTAVAGWHLRNKINENDGDIWKGVAWYHSKTPHLGAIYQEHVMNKYRTLQQMELKLNGNNPRLADRGEY